MRKVTAKIYDRDSRDYKEIQGQFHCWGQEYEEFESGLGNATVAIIELDNGQIVTANPGNVVFTT